MVGIEHRKKGSMEIKIKIIKHHKRGIEHRKQGSKRALKIKSENALPGIETGARIVKISVQKNKFINNMSGESNSRVDCPSSAETLRFTKARPNPNTVAGGGGRQFPPSSSAVYTAELQFFFPESIKFYIIGKLSSRTSQISHYLSLIPPIFSGLKQRSFMNQTLNHHIFLNSYPFQILKLSTSSAVQDLPNHVHETSKGEDENFTYLEWQCFKSCLSSFQMIQIYSSMIAFKLWTRIDGWKHSNPAQSSSSLNMFMHLCSSNLDQFLRTKAWFLLNNAQWTRLCKKIDELGEEISSLKWENFWREKWIWDLELLLWQILLWLC